MLIECSRVGAEERYKAWKQGKSISPSKPKTNLPEETIDSMLDMLAEPFAKMFAEYYEKTEKRSIGLEEADS